MSMFDNYKKESIFPPCNIVQFLEIKNVDTIVAGSSANHVFKIPFKYTNDISIEIIYKQEQRVLLVKNNYTVTIEDEHCFYIECPLSAEETLLFGNTVLNTEVQLKFSLNGEIFYSEINRITVLDSLDNED